MLLGGVSETARYGGLTVGPYVINEDVKRRMREAAERVRNGEFAKEWVTEYQRGAPRLGELLEQVRKSQAEKVGDFLRQLMRSK